jgi:hypothetical protein
MGRLQRALARCLVEIHGAAEHAGSAQLAHRRASAGDGLWLLALSICACVVFLGLLVGAPRASGADEVDANCKVCQQRGEACLTETDANGIRTFHGCCGGIICPGPFLGGTVSVCCNTGVCNVTTGHCVAQCPAGTSLCHDSTCTPDCSPPRFSSRFPASASHLVRLGRLNVAQAAARLVRRAPRLRPGRSLCIAVRQAG